MQIVRVFVSSPGDVAPERGRVQAIAAKLNREYALGGALLQADRSFQKSSEKRQNYSSAALFSDISRKIIRLEQQCKVRNRCCRGPPDPKHVTADLTRTASGS
jgi:hypothetical protein